MKRKKLQGVQYTIRAVPVQVDRALRKKAKANGKSLNETIVEVLQRESGVSSEVIVHHDLDHLIGGWVEDPDFDRALADQDAVDTDVWQ